MSASTMQDGALLIGGPADGVRVDMMAAQDVLHVGPDAYLYTGVIVHDGGLVFWRHESLSAADAMDMLLAAYPVGRL